MRRYTNESAELCLGTSWVAPPFARHRCGLVAMGGRTSEKPYYAAGFWMTEILKMALEMVPKVLWLPMNSRLVS